MKTKTANIYLNNFRHNIRAVRSLYSKDVNICIPVKAQAYGHGAVRMAYEALEEGVQYIAVATVDEGVQLRKEGIACPILVLSLLDDSEIDALVSFRLSGLVHSIDYCKKIAEKAAELKTEAFVHIKIDTGMSRIGCKPELALLLARFIHSCSNLVLQGMCTHLSVSDSLLENDIAFTKKQIALFKQTVLAIQDCGINTGLIHCSNSGAVFLHPEACFDMIRPGIAVYGYFPDRSIAEYMARTYPSFEGLKPVMEVCSKIEQVKTINEGQEVSYGRTWKAEKKTRIATIPLGYADGLWRRFSPGVLLSINGNKYPIVGRICMDQCMADIGDSSDIKEGDTVIFFGPGEGCMTADDFAQIAGTISYEVLCAVGQRVVRNYI